MVESKIVRKLEEERVSISIVRGKGQLTLPKDVRDAAHLEEGDPVEIEIVPEGILLRPRKMIDSTQAWFWTPAWQAGEAEADADIAAGRLEHAGDDELMSAIDGAEPPAT